MQVLTADEVVALGTGPCDGLDRGQPVADEAKVVIDALTAKGLSKGDAKEGMYAIVTTATSFGDTSFCARHSLKSELI